MKPLNAHDEAFGHIVANMVKHSLVVRMARAVRHAPIFRRFDFLWNLVRPIYQRGLAKLAGQTGIPIEIPGVGTISVPGSFLTGDVDSLELPMLRRFVLSIRPDSCLYDVGASVGLHSLVAGERIGENGEIHAFEPDLPSCRWYWLNSALLRRRYPIFLSTCFVSNVSTVADRSQILANVSLEGASEAEMSGGRHLYLFARPADRQIPEIRIDDYVRFGARPPTIIKSDIEGAELLLLRGAEHTIQKYQPELFISLHPELIEKFQYTSAEFFEFLHSHDYEWTILNEIGETHVHATPKNA